MEFVYVVEFIPREIKLGIVSVISAIINSRLLVLSMVTFYILLLSKYTHRFNFENRLREYKTKKQKKKEVRRSSVKGKLIERKIS